MHETQRICDLRRSSLGAALIGGAALAQQQLNIAIATGGTGGVYYPLGRRHGERAVQASARHAGDRARHRRLGRQSQT